MTFTEIYNRVVFKIWLNSTPPEGMATVLQGENGVIANCHRRIQQDYNYWFMVANYEYEVSEDDNELSLPSDYKEAINLFWSPARECTVTSGSTTLSSIDTLGLFTGQTIYGTGVQASTVISSIDHDNNTVTMSIAADDNGSEVAFGEDHGTTISAFGIFDEMSVDKSTYDYPEWYKISGSSIILRGVPYDSDGTESRVLNLQYWKFLDRPTDFTGDTEDDLSTYGAEAICNLAAAETAKLLKEWDTAKQYETDAQRDIELLKAEDRSRRQNQIEGVIPCEF